MEPAQLWAFVVFSLVGSFTPGPNIRPKDQITNMSWTPSESGEQLAHADVHPPQHCSGCHR